MRLGFTSVGAGLAASILAHVLLIGVVAVPHKRQVVHGETFSVDLVSPDEAAAAFADQKDAAEPQKQEPQKEETQPDWSQLQLKDPSLTDQQSQSAAAAGKQQPQRHQQQQSAQQQPQQQPAQQQAQQQQAQQPQAQQQQAQPQQAQQQQAQPQQQPPQQPQPAPPEQQVQPPAQADAGQAPPEHPLEQNTRLAAMLGLPPPAGVEDKYRYEDQEKADLTGTDLAAFRTRLKQCWSLPPGVANNAKLTVIVRVELRQDGNLAREPQLVQGPASQAGAAFALKTVEALKQCQPYNMLPAEKYKEWRTLDLRLSPDQLAGG